MRLYLNFSSFLIFCDSKKVFINLQCRVKIRFDIIFVLAKPTSKHNSLKDMENELLSHFRCECRVIFTFFKRKCKSQSVIQLHVFNEFIRFFLYVSRFNANVILVQHVKEFHVDYFCREFLIVYLLNYPCKLTHKSQSLSNFWRIKEINDELLLIESVKTSIESEFCDFHRA